MACHNGSSACYISITLAKIGPMRLFVLLLSFICLICLSGPSVLASSSKGNNKTLAIEDMPDPTAALRLIPGLTVTMHIWEGLDTHWNQVGDYDFVARIAETEPQGAFIYDWQMSEPAGGSGSRRVEAVDVKHSRKVSLFYPKHEVCTLVGYTNVVRVSDDLFADLKKGKNSDFALDGPESVQINHAETVQLPRSVRGEGTEMVTIKIEGKERKVRCVKAVCDNGWTYWVLDNARLPLLVQGNAPFRWVASLTGVDDMSDASREAKNIYDQLRNGGVATSYLILFDFDSDKLRPNSKNILRELSTYLKKDSGIKLQVEGHTCTIGGYDYNMSLSNRRALSVKRYLTESCGIGAGRLKSQGFGYTKPEKSNATASGRARNRRVIFREIK